MAPLNIAAAPAVGDRSDRGAAPVAGPYDGAVADLLFAGVTKRFGDGSVAVRELDLSVADGELMVLVGPSGCGKSTILRMTAGLEPVTEGSIAIAGEVVDERSPGERDLAMVFQDHALYPHMTAYKNIAFALRPKRLPRVEVDARVREVARLLEVEHLLARRPRALSGGERQRIAIGRAMVRRPRAFLMDEPLSNLDARLRTQMRSEIRRLHDELRATFLFVTHDQVEAMTLGDRVAVLRRGELQQVDEPRALYRRPANVFVASFIGSPAINLFMARPSAAAGATSTVAVGPWSVSVPPEAARAEGVVVGIRPEHFLSPRAEGAVGNESVAWVRAEQVEPLGPTTLVHFSVDQPSVKVPDARSPDGQTTLEVREGPNRAVAAVDGHDDLAPGDALPLIVDERRVLFFDARRGEALPALTPAAVRSAPPLR